MRCTEIAVRSLSEDIRGQKTFPTPLNQPYQPRLLTTRCGLSPWIHAVGAESWHCLFQKKSDPGCYVSLQATSSTWQCSSSWRFWRLVQSKMLFCSPDMYGVLIWDLSAPSSWMDSAPFIHEVVPCAEDLPKSLMGNFLFPGLVLHTWKVN